MTEVGGYFELELNKYSQNLHKGALALNSGRNSFEYILLANNYKTVYIPYLTCDVILEPLVRNNINYNFYYVDGNLEPIFDFGLIKSSDAFLYTNYFGLKGLFIEELSRICRNVIIDNSQAFYSLPGNNVDAFYSPRKFFGIPDGGFVYCRQKLNRSLLRDSTSAERLSHLLKRLEFCAEYGYSDFKNNELTLKNVEIRKMSNLTLKLLANIDFIGVSEIRSKNYDFLNVCLSKSNKIQLDRKNQIPLVYPYQTDNYKLVDILKEKKIFTPTYWPNVLEWTRPESIEFQFVKRTIFLPIDQRYSIKDMEYIVDTLKNA